MMPKVLICLWFVLNFAFPILSATTRRNIDRVGFVSIAESLWAGDSHGHAASLAQSTSILEDSKSILEVKEPNTEVRVSDIPAEFSAATAWPKCLRVEHPRDQGACRSDWAVAAASVLTDRLCIYFWSRFNQPMSAYHVLTCCADCGDGCNSGSAAKAWKFFENVGVVTGGDRHSQVGCLPYQLDPCDHRPTSQKDCSIFTPTKTPSCPQRCIDSRYDFKKDRIFVNRSYAIANDVREIQKEIMRNGPVQASILVYNDLLYYNGKESQGVYYHYAGPLLGGMSVKIIGWGTDPGSGLDYWLVVNSWGTEWGKNGTFRIKRGTNECGIESNVIAGDPSMNHSFDYVAG